jgi:16S rRNA processing protein RimM
MIQGRRGKGRPSSLPLPDERAESPEGRGRSDQAAARPPARREGDGHEDRPDDLVLLGEFGRAHGLKGEVRLKSHTDDPRAIANYAPLVGSDGRAYSLVSLRPAPGDAPDLFVAVVAGVSSREAAEALNHIRLSAPRDRFPPPAEEDEFLLADLIGLTVESRAGERIGAVVAVPDYGGGDLLEIKPVHGGATALLPFTKAFVPEVDLAGRRVVIDAPDDLFAPAKPGAGDRR